MEYTDFYDIISSIQQDWEDNFLYDNLNEDPEMVQELDCMRKNFDDLLNNRVLSYPEFTGDLTQAFYDYCNYNSHDKKLAADLDLYLDDIIDRTADVTLATKCVMPREIRDYTQKENKEYWVNAAKRNKLNFEIIENIVDNPDYHFLYGAVYKCLLNSDDKGFGSNDLSESQLREIFRDLVSEYYTCASADGNSVHLLPGYTALMRLTEPGRDIQSQREMLFLKTASMKAGTEFTYFTNNLFKAMDERYEQNRNFAFRKSYGDDVDTMVKNLNERYDSMSLEDKQLFCRNAFVNIARQLCAQTSAGSDENKLLNSFIENYQVGRFSIYMDKMVLPKILDVFGKYVKYDFELGEKAPIPDVLYDLHILDNFGDDSFARALYHNDSMKMREHFERRFGRTSDEILINVENYCKEGNYFSDSDKDEYVRDICSCVASEVAKNNLHYNDFCYYRTTALLEPIKNGNLTFEEFDRKCLPAVVENVVEFCEFRGEKFENSAFFKAMCFLKMYDKPYLKQNFKEFQEAAIVEQIMDWCDTSPAPFKTDIGNEVRDFLKREYEKNPDVNVFDLYHSVLNKKDFFNDGTYYAIVEEPLCPGGDESVCSLREFSSYQTYLDCKNLFSGNCDSLWEGTASDVCAGLDSITIRSFSELDSSKNKVWTLETEVLDIVVKRLLNETDFYKNHYDISEVRDFLKKKLYDEGNFESFSALCKSVLDNKKLQHNEVLKKERKDFKECKPCNVSINEISVREPNFKSNQSEKQSNKRNNKHSKKI